MKEYIYILQWYADEWKIRDEEAASGNDGGWSPNQTPLSMSPHASINSLAEPCSGAPP
jgi:hypothetical protein